MGQEIYPVPVMTGVLSHATKENDRKLYARAGVEEYRLVHQDKRKLKFTVRMTEIWNGYMIFCKETRESICRL
jgi:Uma2 family endonuclease